MNKLLSKARRKSSNPEHNHIDETNNGLGNNNSLQPNSQIGPSQTTNRGSHDILPTNTIDNPSNPFNFDIHDPIDNHSNSPEDSESIQAVREFEQFRYQDIPRDRVVMNDEYNIYPTTSTPLSEGETLNEDNRERLELQDSYNENFEGYLPFLLRRMRYRSHIEEQQLHHQSFINDDNPAGSLDNDDQPTILEEPIGDVTNDGTTTTIMNRNTSNYNLKRQYLIVNEFIKNNTYLFVNEQSFETFKQLRSSNKKHRKSSTTIYDGDGTIRIVRSELQKPANKKDQSSNGSDHIIDSRNHIIPVDYKVHGLGLPLFKIQVPYMSNFKRHAPYIIFHKYKEVVDPPKLTINGDLVDEEYETYPFCTVHLKKFQSVKRYMFEFNLNDNPEIINNSNKSDSYQNHSSTFKLLLFQHCFKPFSDFVYKGTRFRVLGTPIISAYALNYNPTLKLLIIDNEQESLCDKIINKKSGFEFSSLIKSKLKKLKAQEQRDQLEKGLIDLDPIDYPNPYPSEDCGLFSDNYYQYFNGTGYIDFKDYIPNCMPPFGSFRDALIYKNNLNLIPKRYSEVGKIDLYQDNSHNMLNNNNNNQDPIGSLPDGSGPFDPQQDSDKFNLNSTKSVDVDSLILNTVMLTLRESSIRATARPSNATNILSSRMAGDPRSSGGFGAATTDFIL